MLTKKDFYVGQELILKPSDNRDREKVLKVSSVGRKYVKFGSYMIDLSDKHSLDRRFYQIKNYGARGMFFFSEQEKQDYEELQILKRTIENEARFIGDLELARKIFNLMSE